MNVDSILLSEFATVDPLGRLTVVNSFNRLHGPGPTWMIPMMYLSWVVHAHRDEVGNHQAEIRLLNARRDQLLPKVIKAAFEVNPEGGPAGLPIRHSTVAVLGGLVFKAPGPYAFELYIDDTFAGATPFYVLTGPRG